MQITVCNKHHGLPKGKTFYIGRGSPLGNPYSHLPNTKANEKVSSREESIELYKKYLISEYRKGTPEVVNALQEIYKSAKLQPISLLCFCSPKPCHGDFIKKIILSLEN